MRRFYFGFLFLIVFSAFLQGKALAFYCGSRLVSVGDTKTEVQAKCGEPTSKEVIRKEQGDAKGTHQPPVSVTLEEWVYNLGSNRLIRFYRFENGRLVGVETGGYGD